MDSNQFDNMTRLFGRATSRRSILKGLVGLGILGSAGSGHVSPADARSIGSRPTIPSTPPATTPAPTTSPPDPCPGQEQCPGSSVCCDIGTCTRSGNQAVCCDGTNGHGSVVCGLECCNDPFQCCDSECCGGDDVCLVRAFGGEVGSIEEEVCCPLALTCDGLCCDGECFSPDGPPLLVNGLPIEIALFDRECCPSSASVCQGVANAACCDDATEQCCVDASGFALCAPIAGCCVDDDCLPLPPDADACTVAVCNDAQLCEYPGCPGNLECCVNAPDPICIDLTEAGVCCTTPQCGNGCLVCEATSCVPACEAEACCTAASDPAEWTCITGEQCCVDDDCEGTDEVCCDGTCLSGECCGDSDCSAPETCCIIGNLSFCLDLTVEGACCTAATCPDPGECLVATCIDFFCSEGNDPECCPQGCQIGQRCCPGGYCIDAGDICCNAATEAEDCPADFVCCGGRCEAGECCTGIADDGRCGDGALFSCCRDTDNVTYCVESPTCPGIVTTTTAAPPVTSTTSPPTTVPPTTSAPTTAPPTTLPPQTCAGQFCAACGLGTEACCESEPYCNEGGCGSCMTTISSCSCTIGGNDCCPGLTCVEGPGFNFCSS